MANNFMGVLTLWPLLVIAAFAGLSLITDKYFMYKLEFYVFELVHIPAMLVMVVAMAFKQHDRVILLLWSIIFVLVQIIALPFCLYLITVC